MPTPHRALADRLLAAHGLGEGAAAPDYPSEAAFAEGARVGAAYSCVPADGGVALAVWIGAITEVEGIGVAYGVQIVPLAPRGVLVVGHAPFAAQCFSRCLPDEDIEAELGAPFDDALLRGGYEAWRAEAGGVFSIEISEAYVMMAGLAGEGG